MAQQPDTVAAGLPLQPPPTGKPHSLIPCSMDFAMNDDDVLTEILLRLPAKSLIRFESVCKRWLFLISSDYLCHQHTLRRPKLQPSLILQTEIPHDFFYLNPTNIGEKKIIPISLPASLRVPYFNIQQAVNGLILMKFEPRPTAEPLGKISYYYVYNPTTGRSREIICTNNDEYPHVASVSLAFDPSKSPYYKIICIRSNGEADSAHLSSYQIEVYDSESRTWKHNLFKPFLGDSLFRFSFRGTYWNNAIYGRCCFSNDCHYSRFDIVRNEVKTLPFPQNPFTRARGGTDQSCLQESSGHLYHFEWIHERFEHEGNQFTEISVAVWELVGDDDQWLFMYHHILTSTTAGWATYYILRLIGGSDGDGDGDGACRLLTHSYGDKMMAYSFLDKTNVGLVDFNTQPPFFVPYGIKVFQFGEILALV